MTEHGTVPPVDHNLVVQTYEINPLSDPRWPDLLASQPRASIFHTPGWLNALRDTYGYQPVALTTSAPGTALKDGLVFCRVASWLTGRRLVSLPFSDHCDILGDQESVTTLISSVRASCDRENLKYAELRPTNISDETWNDGSGFNCFESYYLHELDLTPGLDTLFVRFAKNSIRRKIRCAEQERLRCETGSSEKLLNAFYSLLGLTRRRHHLPPQPREWFKNLISFIGDQLTIRVAYLGERPIASILTLEYKNVLVQKYACSDPQFHHLGSVPFLVWRSIQDAKQNGARVMDYGRSDQSATGLIRFKSHWACRSSLLNYYRYPVPNSRRINKSIAQFAAGALSRMPDAFQPVLGRLLYRHVG